MTKPTFAPGQRWISNTESELGLGIVVESMNRRVTLSFPAAGERRTYAEENAPLSRVHYQAGEEVTTIDGDILTVVDVMENNHSLIYACSDQENNTVILPELELDCFVHFNGPKERLLAGQIDNHRRFQLRQETLRHQQSLFRSSVAGLIGPRVQLLPHQLYIASQVSQRHAPRVLLADEVGLGKTIEAGMIAHQQLTSGRAGRVLIIVPDSLIHQWLVEMLRRFNLQFTILDKDRCDSLAGSGTDNPFDSAQLILCSLSLLVENEDIHSQACDCNWDLIIVDEAHHLSWHENEVSTSYTKIEQLTKIAKGLLLLTATPEQLGVDGHFARLRLLDPDRYYDLATFREEEANYKPVNKLVEILLSDETIENHPFDETILEQLRHYLGDDAVTALLTRLADTDKEVRSSAINQATQQLLDQHGTGRVLYRNTRSGIEGFPQRQLIAHPLPVPEQYKPVMTEDNLISRLYPETDTDNLWLEFDTRVEWLVQWLAENRSQKVLLICANTTVAMALEEYLRLRKGVRSCVFHEGLTLIERDRAAAYFADSEEGAQLLICSEIGSEGRNFQFSHNLILFDLPFNPDLLEQRIGRLDRIGQRFDINIHVPYFTSTAQEILLRWYDEGVGAFHRACPAGQEIIARFSSALKSLITSKSIESGELTPDAQTTLTELISETRAFTDSIMEILQQGRDRLIELNSCNPEQADNIVDSLINDEQRSELEDYMGRVFDEYGVEHEFHSENAITIHPSDHMQCHQFPCLPEDGITATFHRTLALSREDMHFLTWEHPMVSGAMDMLLNDDFGNTTLCTLKLPPLKPGTILVEAMYIAQCAAPRELQLQRHLPQDAIRVVLDSNNNNLSHVLSFEHLNKLSEKVPKRMAQDLIRHARSELNDMIAGTEGIAISHQEDIVNTTLEQMYSLHNTELQRLEALSRVNPNIRQVEIDHMKSMISLSEEHIKSIRIKLDALRVVIAT